MARSRPKGRRTPRANPRGVLHATASGHGFVKTAEGEFFIGQSGMGGAFDGDIVEIAPIHVNTRHKQPQKDHARQGRHPSARVVRVVERTHDTLIGRYEIAAPLGIVIPDDPRIPYDICTIHAENPPVADGDAVRVRITSYPTRHAAALGVVEEVIGRADDESLAIDTLIASHKLETKFSDASYAQAREEKLEAEEALVSGYRDIRDRYIFTIDPEDARDFDDAVSIDKVHEGYLIGVHIADVSHYVPWNSSIDLDARRRATSVYLVDRVIPMLPEELSADLCSLKPGEPRRAMTVDMTVDTEFNLKSVDLYPSLILSRARLTYEQAQDMLDRPYDVPHEFLETQSRLVLLHKLAHMCRARREKAGGLDFETTEAKAILDDQGVVTDIVLRKRTDATSLIEEAMILANTAVATHLCNKKFPSLYRVHDAPSAENLAQLVPVLREFGYFKGLSLGEFVAGNPATLQEVLHLSAKKPEADLISTLLLRSMKRAEYRSDCSPHYGLACVAYTHFTSPIRRYPDLVVHRMLKALLFGRPESFEQQYHSLDWIAQHSSKMERVAEAAARQSQEYKIAEYMQSFIGMTFDGVISGVASFGFFVRLENTAEGLVHMKDLDDDYYSLDAEKHRLVGLEDGKVYRLGQKVKVTIKSVSPKERKIDFILARSSSKR